MRGHTGTRWGGSSPLARGLHFPPLVCHQDGGIIPARAGFTRRQRRPRRRRPDHPRSRGVYCSHPMREIQKCGSSPLARGLRRSPLGGMESVGIIPARAGFTPRSSATPTSREDHPRSRGVYDTPNMTDIINRGSSPLARGLHRGRDAVALAQGIIPARAGFTTSRTSSPDERADHPRSRGVYLTRPTIDLADDRIIPARAGFTPLCWSMGTGTTDHPRSRGVYRVK